jgi:hypothetical protein
MARMQLAVVAGRNLAQRVRAGEVAEADLEKEFQKEMMRAGMAAGPQAP